MQVAGYAGILLSTPTVLYEIVAYVVPGLTKSEKDLLAPIVFGSSILFYLGSVLGMAFWIEFVCNGFKCFLKKSVCCRLFFSYEILTPAALNFFVTYADGAVESLWSIDQYFEFVLVLMLSTGLSFQVRSWNMQKLARQWNWVVFVDAKVLSS